MTDVPVNDVPAARHTCHDQSTATGPDWRCLHCSALPGHLKPVAPVVPADRADLRERIRRAICEAEGFAWDSSMLEPDEYGDHADAVLAVLAVPDQRAAVLLWAADQIDAETRQAKADRILEPDKFRPCRDASAQLRRLAGEAQQDKASAAPWASDSARIGRVLIWSWSDIAKGEFGRGYRAAQEEARAILTRALVGEAQRDPALGSEPTEVQPPYHRWYVETRDGVADQWAPGERFTDRAEAVERYQVVTANFPTWKDGTPVERRFVRETTSYTVEPIEEPEQDGDTE